MPKLLGISGSLRKASTNTKLVHEAARAFAPSDWTLADIRFELFDADIEAERGIPPAVQKFASDIREADAVVISTPEYNKSLPGGLKNALDWLSRADMGALNGKPVAIVSAAAGRAGGERAQFSLRHCLTAFMPRVLPGPEVMIAASGSAFDENGRLVDQKSFEFLTKLMDGLKAEIARK